MEKLRYANKMICNPKNKVAKVVLFLGLYIMMLPSMTIAQPSLERVLENIHYRQIGPTRQGGRVVSFAVSKQDHFLFYVAAGPGGVWKTENNGTTFKSVFDNQELLLKSIKTIP